MSRISRITSDLPHTPPLIIGYTPFLFGRFRQVNAAWVIMHLLNAQECSGK